MKRGGGYGWSDFRTAMINFIGNKKPLREGLIELNTIISKKNDINKRVDYLDYFETFKDRFAKSSRNSLQTATFTDNEEEIEKLYQFEKFLFYSVYEKLIDKQGYIPEHSKLIKKIEDKKKIISESSKKK